MSEAHGDAMMYLVGFVVLLMTVLLGVLFVSQTKKTKPAGTLTETKKDAPASVTASKNTLEATVDSKAIVEVAEASGADVDLKAALKKTEENLFGRIRNFFSDSAEVKAHLEDIEEVLYTSDLGPKTVQQLMAVLEDLSRKEKSDYEAVRAAIKNEMIKIFKDSEVSLLSPENDILHKIKFAASGPTVLMIVGVNGAGKTTSIGKISAQLAKAGKKVLVAAGDTFRAAAGGQLKVWTERAQVEIFSPEGVTDPSAVAFDAVAKAKAQNYDVVIVDTAGRLHTQANLMEELKKMKRVMTKVIESAPHETLIVLDANSGQNALLQAKEYHAALQLTGAVLTKMDGTAKGGVAVGLAHELQIPIKLIGVGERIQDLRSFSSEEFVNSILP